MHNAMSETPLEAASIVGQSRLEDLLLLGSVSRRVGVKMRLILRTLGDGRYQPFFSHGDEAAVDSSACGQLGLTASPKMDR